MLPPITGFDSLRDQPGAQRPVHVPLRGSLLRPLIGVVISAMTVAALSASPAIAVKSPTTKKPTVTTAAPRSTKSAAKTGIDAAVDAAMTFVEKERGNRFKSRPKTVILAKDAFLKELRVLARQSPEFEKDRAGFGSVLKSLGLVRASVDTNSVLDTFTEGAVGGFYDPKQQRLVVLAGKVTEMAKVILVHELTHALDDQHFGLDRPALDTADDDRAAAFQFLVEGTARYVENRYRASLSAKQKAAVESEELQMSLSSGLLALFTDPDVAPAVPFMITLFLGPYEIGKGPVADAFQDGGSKAVDAMFKRPPVTTEQAADYQRWKDAENERAVAVPAVPAGARILDQGVIGLAGFNAMVADLNDVAGGQFTIPESVIGWGGDRYVVWSAGTKTCLRSDVLMDSPKDAVELRTRLSQNTNWRVAAQGSDGIRFESCSA